MQSQPYHVSDAAPTKKYGGGIDMTAHSVSTSSRLMRRREREVVSFAVSTTLTSFHAHRTRKIHAGSRILTDVETS